MKTPALIVLALAATALAACGKPAEATKPQAKAVAPTADPPNESGDQRAEAAARTLIGERAPPLKLRTIDGKTIDLAKSLGGKPIYLKFWATWCVPCREQMPHFEHAYETLGKDVEVVAINTNLNETLDGVKAYRKAHGLKMPIVIDDGRLGSALNLRVTPTHVLIDRTGHIVYVGHSADAKLDGALQGLRASTAQIVADQDKTAAPVTTAIPASARTSAGQTFPFADPQGRRKTVLVFFATWCEDYLKDSQPAASRQCKSIREQADRLAGPGEVRLIGVASGLWTNAHDLKDYETQNKVHIPITLDASGDLFRAFHVTRSPTVVVLGPDGRESKRYVGEAVVGASKALAAKATARNGAASPALTAPS
jgi:thiol-disulfide isomerase/thioredoxin